jgi:D-proline reductase (dithiol) PrdB
MSLVFEHDAPIAYMQRTRDYYQALGYRVPYRWAHYAADDVPFAPLTLPLARTRVALVTTAAPYQPEAGDQGSGAAYNAAAKFYAVYSVATEPAPDLRIAHVAYDRAHTNAADPNTWLPLAQLHAAVRAGRIGALTPRVHGVPTNRSQRVTLQTDAPELLRRLREDGADAALLVPNCPVCHQSVSLLARHLEANGLPTVIVGCARDIVEHCGVPRFVFSDFPLGNSAGKPFDSVSQADTLELALHTLETTSAPRSTVQSPQRWSVDSAWKRDYGRVDHLTPEEISALRAEFDAGKELLKHKPGRS